MKEYIEDKMQIFANQHSSDYLVTLKTTYKKYQQEIDKYLCSKLVLVEENYFPCQPKYLLGEHNFLGKCVMPFYNEIAHIPLFIWDPRSKKQAERRNSLVQMIDIAPTLYEYFDVPIDTVLAAKDRAPHELEGSDC